MGRAGNTLHHILDTVLCSQSVNNTVLFLIIMYIFVQVARHCEPTKE